MDADVHLYSAAGRTVVFSEGLLHLLYGRKLPDVAVVKVDYRPREVGLEPLSAIALAMSRIK